jgi:hypothetical protein
MRFFSYSHAIFRRRRFVMATWHNSAMYRAVSSGQSLGLARLAGLGFRSASRTLGAGDIAEFEFFGDCYGHVGGAQGCGATRNKMLRG